MAITLADAENQILTEKGKHTELDVLNTTSTVSVWGLLVTVFASVSVWFSQILDKFLTDVGVIIASNDYGTDPWWQQKILAFQFGDILQFIDNRFQYAVIDATKKIVNYVAIASVGGRVQIKVATSVDNAPGQLSTAQYNALLSYCQQIRPSGSRFSLINLPADTLKLYLNVYYSAQADINVVQPAVELAINNYIANLYLTRLDGAFEIDGLINAVQAVAGVTGPQCEVITAWATNSGNPYTQFTAAYPPASGYFEIDQAYPLADTINYISI